MDEEIELVPNGPERGKHRVDRLQVLDVAAKETVRCAQLSGKRGDPFAQGVILIGEGEFGAFAGQGLGYAPGDRVIIRDAHHQAAFAAHQARCHGRSSIRCSGEAERGGDRVISL